MKKRGNGKPAGRKELSRRKRWQNAVLWSLVAEVTAIMAICMMIAVSIGGWIGMAVLGVCVTCALWLNLFVQVNAEVFERRIRRSLRRIDRTAKAAAARLRRCASAILRKRSTGCGEKQPVERQFTYVTFTRP